MKAKSANAVDVYVGGRVRQRRKALGMSQSNLAESLGITFQQIQKYEKGINRIGASRLQLIADIFAVPVGYFFENAAPSEMMGARAESDEIAQFMSSKEGIALSKAFLAIEDANVRQKLLALARSLGASSLSSNNWEQLETGRG
ncbi:helix-turn-helix transcriptional regulator [Rhizobium sp. S152]|uniref:helix-turn-helix domain-containing protein n=1 Tax=Rhizobium sp. S152 TaxID=3055038 RepID=UPI0025AA1B10|nr:helix-turn-helix transcriptional regulator [Rhizobium sp. S152]MDM9625520.1 helix-turn-helix transcriptional regulator [Rhizobium sp. S152]